MNPTDRAASIISDEQPQPLTEAEVAALDSGLCPDCAHEHFLEGPHGGMNVNIQCANCGAKFNIIPRLAGSFGKQRIPS